MRTLLRTILPLALLAAACAPPEVSGDVEAWVVARTDAGPYDLVQRTLTVDDLSSLSGSLTSLWARSRLEATGTDATSVRLAGGAPIQLRLEEVDGAFMGRDFDALMCLTLYHHLNAAHAYFQGLGLGTEVADVPHLPTHYLPTVGVLGFGLPLLTDNAGYTPAVSAFLVFGQSQLDEVPLAANEGVMAHEFAHAVFHHLTGRLRGVDLPEWMLGDWPVETANALRAVDEGLADVHGAAFTGDPDFIAPSASALELDRDVSFPRAYGDGLAAALGDALEDFDPYAIGSVVASTFWDFRGRLVDAGVAPADARRRMSRAAFETARTLEVDRDFTLGRFWTTAVAAVPAEDRPALCAALDEAFADLMPEVGGC